MKILLSLIVLSSSLFATPEENLHIHNHKESILNKKICIVGDVGEGRKTQVLVGQAMKNDGCEQIRVTGDVIYPSGLKNSNDMATFKKKFLNPYKDLLLTKDPIPFYIALGNHDWKGDAKAWQTIHKKYPQIFHPHYYYAETWQDVCIITLDTDYYAKPKHLPYLRGFKQRQWLKKVVKKIGPKCRFSLYVAHHPYRSVGKHGNAILLLKQFLNSHVVGRADLYVAGHDHNLSDEGQKDGTRLLVSGAGVKLRRVYHKVKPGNYAASALGYVVVQLKNPLGSKEIIAEYTFKELQTDAKGNWTSKTKATRKGQVLGRGIR